MSETFPRETTIELPDPGDRRSRRLVLINDGHTLLIRAAPNPVAIGGGSRYDFVDGPSLDEGNSR